MLASLVITFGGVRRHSVGESRKEHSSLPSPHGNPNRRRDCETQGDSKKTIAKKKEGSGREESREDPRSKLCLAFSKLKGQNHEVQ